MLKLNKAVQKELYWSLLVAKYLNYVELKNKNYFYFFIYNKCSFPLINKFLHFYKVRCWNFSKLLHP